MGHHHPPGPTLPPSLTSTPRPSSSIISSRLAPVSPLVPLCTASCPTSPPSLLSGAPPDISDASYVHLLSNLQPFLLLCGQRTLIKVSKYPKGAASPASMPTCGHTEWLLHSSLCCLHSSAESNSTDNHARCWHSPADPPSCPCRGPFPLSSDTKGMAKLPQPTTTKRNSSVQHQEQGLAQQSQTASPPGQAGLWCQGKQVSLDVGLNTSQARPENSAPWSMLCALCYPGSEQQPGSDPVEVHRLCLSLEKLEKAGGKTNKSQKSVMGDGGFRAGRICIVKSFGGENRLSPS